MSEIVTTELKGDLPTSQTPYFAVSLLKLLVMSLCTFSLYELYWFYKNWCYVRDQEKIQLSPSLRSLIFPYFFCYSLLCKIRASAQKNSIKDSFLAGPLATGWIVFSLLGGLPSPYGYAPLLSVVFLLPVQIAANKINGTVAPEYDRNSRFTKGNIITIIIGASFSLAVAIGHRS